MLTMCKPSSKAFSPPSCFWHSHAVYSKIIIMYKKLARLDNYCHKSLIMIIIMWPTGSRRCGLVQPMGKRSAAHFQNKRRHYTVQYNQRTHFSLMWGQFGPELLLDKQNQLLAGNAPKIPRLPPTTMVKTESCI